MEKVLVRQISKVKKAKQMQIRLVSNIKKAQKKKKKNFIEKHDKIVAEYTWKKNRYESKGQFLTPEEVNDMQNAWLKQWFVFLELYKAIKLLNIMSKDAKKLKFTMIHYVACVRKIQKGWLRAQIFKKIKYNIGFRRTLTLLWFIKFMKRHYSKVIKDKKMKRVVNHFMINNLKTRFRTKMSMMLSKV